MRLAKPSSRRLVILTIGLLVPTIQLNSMVVQTLGQEEEGNLVLHGDTKVWHPLALDVEGPWCRETDRSPNPFLDYRLNVLFQHRESDESFLVPGFFAASGDAGEDSADEGNIWRAYFTPHLEGEWTYRVLFHAGPDIAIQLDRLGEPVAPCHNMTGTFSITATDKSGRDFRGRGRLQYVDEHYLRFAGDGTYFLKAGPDSPETLLAYEDFDGTEARKQSVPLKRYASHLPDWREGDPQWHAGKGRGLIGAVNYLAAQGLNSISFLPYNAGGDGDNVWPFVSRDDKFHYDCSKLAQWNVVFTHAQQQGLYLHFKLQETELDDRRRNGRNDVDVPTSLDGGELGRERKLYCREIVARFAHHLALNWNLGEENTQSTEEQMAMAKFIGALDPYDHHCVVHSFPDQQERVYHPLLGPDSGLTGASLQNSWRVTHQRTRHWRIASRESGHPWVVANDEQNPASHGVPADPGYAGHDGIALEDGREYTLHDIRRYCLWGNLMAGGAGVEYYFGYELPQNDLQLQDFRSREQSWKYCRIAIDFFGKHQIPIERMECRDELISRGTSRSNSGSSNSASATSGSDDDNQPIYCFAEIGKLYLIYFHAAEPARLDLRDASGDFRFGWFNPRSGGDIAWSDEVREGGDELELELPPEDQDNDWLLVIERIE